MDVIFLFEHFCSVALTLAHAQQTHTYILLPPPYHHHHLWKTTTSMHGILYISLLYYLNVLPLP